VAVREQEPVSSFMDSFSQYPVEVQEAINRLKSQYQLEDGDIETVVNNLWSDPANYYEENMLSPEEAYITLPRSDNFILSY